MTRKAHNRLPDDLVARMYADYQRTGSMIRAGALHGRSGSTLLMIFRQRGLPTLGHRGERVGQTRRKHLDDEVARMHVAYQRGLSLTAVGRMFGPRTGKTVRGLFMLRGFAVRPAMTKAKFRANGCFAPYVPHTAAEIDAMIATEPRLRVPVALKQEWRHWSLEQRGEFIARLRARLASPYDRPRTPFSAGMEPFDYTTPRAWKIVDAMNIGRDSRGARMKLNLCSQGVIWRDQLWCWSHKVGYQRGIWTPENGRPSLHKVIWEEANGRKVPRSHVLRFADGNRNNFDPANLVLAHRNDVARENQAAALARKARTQTALLLQRHQTTTDAHPDLLHRITRRPARAAR